MTPSPPFSIFYHQATFLMTLLYFFFYFDAFPKKSPKTIEESIDILKKSKSYIDLVVERQDRDRSRSLSEEKIRRPKGFIIDNYGQGLN